MLKCRSLHKSFIILFYQLLLINTTLGQSNDTSLINFKGYRVPSNIKSIGADYYKRNASLMKDLIIQTFQRPLSFAEIANQNNCIQGGWGGSTCGDFNNDGWIDIFTPGGLDSSMYKDRNRGVGFSFLIWDSTNKKFNDCNLLNNKNIEVIISPFKTVPVYLNKDDYIDLVIFPGDDAIAPVKIILSDGKGSYDYSEIITNENDMYPIGVPGGKPTIYKGSGDVGDLNEDGLPDIYISGNNFSYILWGISSFPYFDPINHPKFVYDTTNFPGFNNNGFGEKCISCTNSFDGQIFDINNDGKNDLIIYGAGKEFDLAVLNNGKGRFNDNNVLRLPRYIPNGDDGDFLMMDINNDGLNDLVTVTGGGLSGKNSYNNIYALIQKTPLNFYYDTTIFLYANTFKTKFLGGAGGTGAHLISCDFNNDGKLDIGYINSGWGDDCGLYDPVTNRGNIMPYKTVFIREGDKYIEKDYFQYDPYAKSILKDLKLRFLCSPASGNKIIKPTFNTSKYSFCSGDSLKLSITNVNKGDTLKWFFGTKSDLTNVVNKTFTDSSKVYVTRTDSVGCMISSDTIQLKKYAIPSSPSLVRDTANNLVASINGITWYKDGVKISDTTQKIKPTSNGMYTATTTQNGCTSSISQGYYYLTNAVSNLSNGEYFKISPNPTSGELNINYKISSSKNINISVFDINGRAVLLNKKVESGSRVNLGSISKGNYIIQVKDGSGKIITSQKLVKE